MVRLTAAIAFGVLGLVACDAESSDEQAGDARGATTGVTDGGQSSTDSSPTARPRAVRVARVLDGDTIDLRNGKRVRLVQIDSPETGECYGNQAGRVLSKILPAGANVVLERDPVLDDVDRYGRLLRYVSKGGTNVNLVLVKRGTASVWFFDGDRGRYADRLIAAARQAKAGTRGAWGACRAKLDPRDAFETQPKFPMPTVPRGFRGGSCMAGYSPCLPVKSELDCDDVEAMGKAPVRVKGSDPYGLDGDGDGVGCD